MRIDRLAARHLRKEINDTSFCLDFPDEGYSFRLVMPFVFIHMKIRIIRKGR